jgi:hypothetical protein
MTKEKLCSYCNKGYCQLLKVKVFGASMIFRGACPTCGKTNSLIISHSFLDDRGFERAKGRPVKICDTEKTGDQP